MKPTAMTLIERRKNKPQPVDGRELAWRVEARRIATCLLIAAAAWPLSAQEPGKATGRFQSQDAWFNAGGSYAFPVDEIGISEEPGILVAVSNAGFVPQYIDYYWDRKNAIETFFKDEETAVVYFTFDNSGKYRGVEYYVGPGNGCGFCFDPKATSTVKLGDGRLAGKLAYKSDEDSYSFDIEIDVPIAFSDYGTALPADGGEPGNVYSAYHQAMAGLSEATLGQLGSLLSTEIAASLSEHGLDYARYLGRSHPTSYRIVRGFTRGERALLVLEGSNDLGEVTVEAHLVRQGGQWKFDEEVLQLAL